MKISVILQPPFDFAPFWLWLGVGLLLAAVGVWIALRFLPQAGVNLRGYGYGGYGSGGRGSLRHAFWRWKSLWRLRRIEANYVKGSLDNRQAHQLIARAVRAYAEAVTGQPITRLVHAELRQLPYPRLAEFIGELRAPEFALESRADIRETIRKSKGLIKRWR